MSPALVAWSALAWFAHAWGGLSPTPVSLASLIIALGVRVGRVGRQYRP